MKSIENNNAGALGQGLGAGGWGLGAGFWLAEVCQTGQNSAFVLDTDKFLFVGYSHSRANGARLLMHSMQEVWLHRPQKAEPPQPGLRFLDGD